MLELLDIHFNYLCRTTFHNENGQCPIILRIVFRGERRDMFTGLYCFKDNWNKKDRKVLKTEKNAAGLNQNLELIQRKAVHVFDELKFIGDAFTIDELVDRIKGKESRPMLLIEFLEEGNQKMKKRVGSDIILPDRQLLFKNPVRNHNCFRICRQPFR